MPRKQRPPDTNPMPDGMKPSVDNTLTDKLYEKYEADEVRAVEFVEREAPPLIDTYHEGRNYCPDCAAERGDISQGWRPEAEFGKDCRWLCRKHWQQRRAAYMRHYRAKKRTDKRTRRIAKRKGRKNEANRNTQD